MVQRSGNGIDRVDVSAFSIPTDALEADGTYQWDKTVLVLVQVAAQGTRGLGYTYADIATAHFIPAHLEPLVLGNDPTQVPALWIAMQRAVRNLGRQGVAAMAILAVDTALWDLNARLLQRPLIGILGEAREAVPVYGSGGFTSYSPQQLQEQLEGWVSSGISQVKMKIGTHPEVDLERVKFAREVIGQEVALPDAALPSRTTALLGAGISIAARVSFIFSSLLLHGLSFRPCEALFHSIENGPFPFPAYYTHNLW